MSHWGDIWSVDPLSITVAQALCSDTLSHRALLEWYRWCGSVRLGFLGQAMVSKQLTAFVGSAVSEDTGGAACVEPEFGRELGWGRWQQACRCSTASTGLWKQHCLHPAMLPSMS